MWLTGCLEEGCLGVLFCDNERLLTVLMLWC